MTTHVRSGPPKIRIWVGSATTSEIVLDHDVIAFEASTSLAAPMGTWSITVLPRQSDNAQTPGDVRRASNLYNSLRPNMVVTIGFEVEGGILIGLLNTVQMTQQLSGPVVATGLTITGSTMGKVLVQDSIYRGTVTAPDYPDFKKKVESALGPDTPITTDIVGTLGPVDENRGDNTPTFVLASVTSVVDWILQSVTSMRLPIFAIATGGSGEPADFIKTDKSVTTWHDARVNGDSLSSYTGTVWGYITGVLDRDFYECWIDSVPNGTSLPDIHLIIRPKPYDEPDFDIADVDRDADNSAEWAWDTLTTMVDGLTNHEIALDEVLNLQRGFGDTDATSWYVVTGQYDLIASGDAETNGVFYPLVDTYTARTLGLRNYNARVSLVGGDVQTMAAGDADYDATRISEAINARNRLFNWYRYAPWMETGSVTVVGRDTYRPGDPVLLPFVTPAQGGHAGMRYYCVAVNWQWSHGGHYTSTLQLARGHNSDMLTAIRDMIDSDAAQSAPDCPHHFASVD